MNENRKISNESNPWARVQSTLDDHSLNLMSTANALKQASDEIGKCNQNLERLGAKTNDLALRVETVVKTAAARASEVATDELVKQLNSKLTNILADHLKSADRRVIDAWSKELSSKLAALDRESEELRKRVVAHEKQYEEAMKRLASIQTKMSEVTTVVQASAVSANSMKRRTEDIDARANRLAEQLTASVARGRKTSRFSTFKEAWALAVQAWRTMALEFVVDVDDEPAAWRLWLEAAFLGNPERFFFDEPDDGERRYPMAGMSRTRKMTVRLLTPKVVAWIVGGSVRTRRPAQVSPSGIRRRSQKSVRPQPPPETVGFSFNDDDIPF
jgi:septal ring factor EnvC (AmiA/AmiB activator)